MLTTDSNNIIKELKSKIKYEDFIKNNNLKKIFELIESYEFDYNVPEIIHKMGKYPCNEFMDKNLYNKSKEYPHITFLKWTCKSIYSVDISLNIYSNNIEEIDSDRVNLLVYVLSFIFSFSNKNRKTSIHIILLGDKKKYKEKFNRKEVNSAGCIINEFESKICVWRLEECIKVLFHECIHAIRLSSLNDNPRIIENYNKKYYGTSKEIRIDEAYTEIWSRILNCYFVSKITSFNELDINLYKYFCILLSVEREFSYLQATKIINYLKKDKKKDLNKETSILSYYVITAEIFANFDKFLLLMGNSLYLKNEKLFESFLLSCKKVPTKRLNKKNKSYTSMRMSAIELKI